METFVHNGDEVVLTGRTATRQLRSKNFKLVEIKRLKDDGWVEWVDPTVLFRVEDPVKISSTINLFESFNTK